MLNLGILDGNWIDILILILLLYYIWEGVGRGLLLATIDLLGFFLSFLASIKLYSFIAQLLIAYISLSRGMANAASFLLVGLFTQMVYSLIASYLYQKIPKTIIRAPWNRWLGFVPNFGSGIIMTLFLLTLLMSLPVKGSIKSTILAGRISGPMIQQTQGIEKDLKSIFGEAVNESLTFFTIAPQSEERVDLNFTQKDVVVSPEKEKEMLALVNQERVKVGLKPLIRDEALIMLARAHARDMFVRGYFSHYSPEGTSPFMRMDKAGIQYQAAGENLALAPSVNLAHEGLVNSEGHRKNILSPDFGKVGIGAVDGGVYGMMFVQEFTD